MTFEEKLRLYAKTAVRTGVNIKENQELYVSAPISCAELARLIAEEAYKAGAKDVYVNYNDEELTYLRYKNAPDTSFEDEFPKWIVNKRTTLLDRGAAVIGIAAGNPELLKDVDQDRVGSWLKKQSQALEEYSFRLSGKNEVQWLVISAPNKAITKKMYPDMDLEKATALHWEEIFKACRITNGKPVEEWAEHVANIKSKVQWLNEERFTALHFENSDKSTDLTIGLVDEHLWCGAGDDTFAGHPFMPNLPTEEVFTMPHSHKVDGVIKSTKPLNHNGNLIDNFTLTFKDGEIIEYDAEVGLEALKNLLESDEGARRIGEVALVPDDSPISNSGKVFFNTLFDENASCHLAFGRAYPTNIENGANTPKPELKEKGANSSIIHVDFMVGSKDLNITGITKDGKKIPVFTNGNWA